MAFSTSLLPRVRRTEATADGFLFGAGNPARPRGRLRHLPQLSEEHRFDQDGPGRSHRGRTSDDPSGLMGARARIRETANEPVGNLTVSALHTVSFPCDR